MLKFVTAFQQGAPQFHIVLGPEGYEAGFDAD